MNSLFPYFDKVEHLRSADSRFACLVDTFGYLERTTGEPLFECLVRNILSQQIATSVAERTLGKLLAKVGSLTPEAIGALSEEDLRQVGLPLRKARWIVSAAERFAAGEFQTEELERLDDEALLRRLQSLDGVGLWSAEMLMAGSLGRENILSWGDLGIRRAISTLYGEKRLTPKRFERYRKLFAPYGSIASLYLWAYSNSLPKRQTEITIRPLGFGRLKDKSVEYNFYPSSHGELLVASTVKGVCRVAFADDHDEALDELRAEMRGAILEQRSAPSHRDILKVIEGRGPKSLTLYLEGTPFERKVWRELLKVPYGMVVSYASIAAATGFTKAFRSVGNAVSANPIAIAIPCHRIIHADGTIGDYNAGTEKKHALIRKEIAPKR
ncbi:MAG: methylated-DNA--[protein]-cysteine S-methyltransferase [Tidjanibacter sp.]|nr:methylated-DNA--[protein]-cysteine S-methyltransferase [Tidjanibacter sp.]